jgi:hypothetical protein
MTSQSGSMLSGASEASVTGEPSGAAIDLYWLPWGGRSLRSTEWAHLRGDPRIP